MKLLYVACAATALFVACADKDPLSSTADRAAKSMVSDGPTAGLPEPRLPAHFTVRIENLATLLAPGAWVAQRGGTPLFVNGQPDRGAGLEALAEDGNPAQLAASLTRNSGVFTTPVGAASPGPLTVGNAYEFSFIARPGDRLSFATMYVQSNDLFLAPGETGIALFIDGQPISGDVTAQIGLWDAGTEVNEAPGVGANQAPRQAAANTGADEGGVVRLVDDGYTYPAVADVVRITITSQGGVDPNRGGVAGDTTGDVEDGLTGPEVAVTPNVLVLTNALISYFQDALLVALISDAATIAGASGGTLIIAGNEWVLTDYSPDGTLVLNGTLNVGEDQHPNVPMAGELTVSGAFNGTVSLDLVVDVSGDEPSLSGTITVGVPYDIGAIIAAAEAGDSDADSDTGDSDADSDTGDSDADSEAGDSDGDSDTGDSDADSEADDDAGGITAAQVVDRATLEAFVWRAKAKVEALSAAEVLAFLETFRTEGEWKSGAIYLYVADLAGNILFHGADPSLEGQNLINLEDKNGVKFVQELLAQVANGGGFVEYLWDNPIVEGDEDRGSPKVGYAAPLNALGQKLAIVAGFYPLAISADIEFGADVDTSIDPTDPTDPVAGLPDSRESAQFTVRIENLGTLLAPGAWVAQRGGEPFFTNGQPDRGAGLEALAEDGNPMRLAASLPRNSGVFITPVGADSPGALTPGNAYEFSFVARSGDRLSFATMYVQSNDLFLAPGDTGIALFINGQPISGDVTGQIGLWDAGTEVNEQPGVGANQAPRQAAANTGIDEGGVVRLVDDGFTYPAVANMVRVTISASGG